VGGSLTRRIARIAVVASMFATAACASLGASSGAGVSHIDRLAFGLGIRDTGFVSDSAWADFIRDVVTPRFPGGFAVYRTEGQWRYENGTIGKEPGRIIELIHVPDAATEAKVVEIADYFIRKFDQEAVGRHIIHGSFTLIYAKGRP
jgi:hypothetical protein